MNTNQLKQFLAVAQYLSFSEAAKKFYMTQPAINWFIALISRYLIERPEIF